MKGLVFDEGVHGGLAARAAQFGLRVVDVPIALESYALSQIWHPRRDGDDGHGWLRARVRDAVAATKPRR